MTFQPPRQFVAPRGFAAHNTRAQSTRQGEVRSIFERPQMDRWAPPSILSMPEAQGGYRYRWIAEYVQAQYQDNNVNKAFAEGYRPVHRDELPPNYAVSPSEDGCVRMGGLILMKIPEEFAIQRQEHFQRKTNDAVNSANELQGIASGPGPKLPVHQVDNSRTLEGVEAFRALNERGS